MWRGTLGRSKRRCDERAGRVLHARIGESVLEGIRLLHVADAAGRLLDRRGHAGVALAAGAGRELDLRRGANLRLELRADVREVVGERVRISRAVGAIDRRDLGGRQVDSHIELRDRGWNSAE